MPADVVLRGEPMRLDVVYRPIAWVFMVPPGAAISLALWCWGYVWVAPLPFVAAWLLHTLIFWMRGDRPCRLTLGDDEIRLEDPRREHEVRVPTAALHSATLTLRAREDGGSTALLVLWGETEPLLSLRAAVPTTEAREDEVDGDLVSASIGGDGGTAYAFAPVGRVGRQLLRDPKGAIVQWYRALPETVRHRLQVRMWRGEGPELDLLGRHEEAWDAVLHCEGAEIALVEGTARTPLALPWGIAHSARTAMLLQSPDGLDGTAESHLDLAVLTLGGSHIAFPAGLANDLGDELPLGPETLHTHSGEGGALFAHLLRHTDRSRWPRPLPTIVDEATALLARPTS